jgi:L-lactate dehydrogenase complex protein LldG
VTSAREEIMDRIRAALRDRPGVDQGGRIAAASKAGQTREQLTDLLVGRLHDYGAPVEHTDRASVHQGIGNVCHNAGLHRLVAAPDVPAAWRPADVEVIEDRGLTLNALEEVDGCLTGCALAVADTGTLLLDAGPRQGRRLLTLLPATHVCVVEADQIVLSISDAIMTLEERMRGGAPPLTMISGPSATTDIELVRVSGVHGPRRLLVVLVG